jgi:hypothetical protein
MKPITSARLMVPLFAAAAVFAIQRRVSGAEYQRLTHDYNVAGDWALACVWAAAAIAALAHRRGVGLVVVCVGAAATLMHGLMVLVDTSSSAGSHWMGIPFVLAGAIEVVLTARAAPAFHGSALPG